MAAPGQPLPHLIGGDRRKTKAYSETLRAIAPSPLLNCKTHQSIDRRALVVVAFDERLSACTDPAPLANKACSPEKIALNTHPIESSHVARDIDPPEIQRCREDLMLGADIEHIAVSKASLHNIR